MQNRPELAAPGLQNTIINFCKTHRRQLGMAASAAGGYVMASAYIFGGVSPFGVAVCAALGPPFALCAGAGAILGYTLSAALTNMQYLVAVVLVLALQWALRGRIQKKHATTGAALMALGGMGVSGAILAVVSGPTLYDIMLLAAEVLLGAGSAYFFARAVRSMELGLGAVNQSDLSCIIVSFAIVIMGFAPIEIGGLSVGRMLAVLAVLLCAQAGGEAGGAVAGITAGIAMGLTGGDYAYAISAYGLGGLLAAVFGGLGRLWSAGIFIVVNTVTALLTKGTNDVYVSLLEIFVVTVIYVALPKSWISQLKIHRPRTIGDDPGAQGTLQSRLVEVSGVLRDIGVTTREVNQRLGMLERGGESDIYNRVAERVCLHCGLKTTCWQFRYTSTMDALNDAMALLKVDGSINRERMPKHFVDTCCNLDDFLSELNIQFHEHVSRLGVKRKVSRVRAVVTDQFDGLAMMLEELAEELGSVTPLEPVKTRRVQEYFEKEGFTVERIRCFTDRFDRMTVEVVIPQYQIARLGKGRSALDLCELLDGEFDRPALTGHGESITAAYYEKAGFSVEVGACQLTPEKNKLCGDAYECIANRGGRAHLILSDGMGSGGGAAVDSHMTTGLFSKLISVGFSHEAAMKMVNSALLIKSGEESLATVDICTIDLYTGVADSFKAGAAPTYLLREGQARSVESTSLPAGILQGIGFEKTTLNLREKDVLVMVSDGVTASGSGWIPSELTALAGETMQRMAQRLAETARTRRTDGREDDITVVAVALRRGV